MLAWVCVRMSGYGFVSAGFFFFFSSFIFIFIFSQSTDAAAGAACLGLLACSWFPCSELKSQDKTRCSPCWLLFWFLAPSCIRTLVACSPPTVIASRVEWKKPSLGWIVFNFFLSLFLSLFAICSLVCLYIIIIAHPRRRDSQSPPLSLPSSLSGSF